MKLKKKIVNMMKLYLILIKMSINNKNKIKEICNQNNKIFF